ncbi:MAG: FAD:protein FMN transferase [Candidatus Saganbacteria bacterium]|nr:FAD:protein FMN transferase [Candidatus Saganbacteria bacterium]
MKVCPFHFFIAFLLLLIVIEVTYTKLIFSAERSAYIMDTPVRVRVNGSNSPHFARKALHEIKRLDKHFSKFNPKSEVSLINELAGEAPLQVSPDTFRCIEYAVEMNKLTGGEFDITLGNPKDLEIIPELASIYIRRKGVSIDLGGIGKGYAAESARNLLLKSGAKSGIIDMRSSIAVFGERTLKIGIKHPRSQDELIGVVELSDGESLATSGDYERGSHIIDPLDRKIPKTCQSVTVVGTNAAQTDALSTAVFVLGPEKGMALIESLPDIEGLIVDAQGRVSESAGLDLEIRN